MGQETCVSKASIAKSHDDPTLRERIERAEAGDGELQQAARRGMM